MPLLSRYDLRGIYPIMKVDIPALRKKWIYFTPSGIDMIR